MTDRAAGCIGLLSGCSSLQDDGLLPPPYRGQPVSPMPSLVERRTTNVEALPGVW